MDSRLHEQLREVGAAHWWYEGRRRIVEAQLEQLFEPGPHREILEVGCGSGSMLPVLARFGNVTAIEPDGGAVEYCRSTYGAIASVLQGRVPDDLPAKGSYDLVGAFDVLEHLADDVGALEAIGASLRRGGRLVATVPAFPSLWGRQDELSHHFRRYRADRLTNVVERAGLHIDRLTYFNTVLFAPIAFLRLTRRVAERLSRAHLQERGSDFDAGPRGWFSNRLLAGIFGLERHLLRRRDLPVGVSLLLIAQAS